MKYIQENYPESIGMAHHHSLYDQDGSDTKVVMVIMKNENRGAISSYQQLYYWDQETANILEFGKNLK